MRCSARLTAPSERLRSGSVVPQLLCLRADHPLLYPRVVRVAERLCGGAVLLAADGSLERLRMLSARRLLLLLARQVQAEHEGRGAAPTARPACLEPNNEGLERGIQQQSLQVQHRREESASSCRSSSHHRVSDFPLPSIRKSHQLQGRTTPSAMHFSHAPLSSTLLLPARCSALSCGGCFASCRRFGECGARARVASDSCGGIHRRVGFFWRQLSEPADQLTCLLLRIAALTMRQPPSLRSGATATGGLRPS